jgi:hypothetical protein
VSVRLEGAELALTAWEIAGKTRARSATRYAFDS